jgi:hypothetical protein
MSHAAAIVVALFAALMLGACSGAPPKPVLPDGLHRVPVNRGTSVPTVPRVSVVSPVLRASLASSIYGGGS